MAKITLNPALKAFHGKIGGLVFKQFAGKEIVASAPGPRSNWTEGQLAQRQQFKLAAIYGKTALANPDTKTIYEAKSKQSGVPVFALTVADFFNPPVVDEVDLSGYSGQVGDTIKITAHDDFKVTGVQVVVRDNGGAVVEQGAATLSATDGSWQYKATATLAQGQAVVIEVSATDLPGHKGIKTQTK